MREYRQALLRRSFRNAQGKPSKETLANLSALPDEAIDAIRKVLAGKTLVTLRSPSPLSGRCLMAMSVPCTSWRHSCGSRSCSARPVWNVTSRMR